MQRGLHGKAWVDLAMARVLKQPATIDGATHKADIKSLPNGRSRRRLNRELQLFGAALLHPTHPSTPCPPRFRAPTPPDSFAHRTTIFAACRGGSSWAGCPRTSSVITLADVGAAVGQHDEQRRTAVPVRGELAGAIRQGVGVARTRAAAASSSVHAGLSGAKRWRM